MRLATFLPGLALIVALTCQTPARADDKPIKVPFETLKTQHITVQVKINGKGPYRLIFDTGAPFSLINSKVAKEANVFPKDFKRPFFAFFGSMGDFKIKSVELGEVKLDDFKVIVMDHPTVAAISQALGPIEGIIGFNFFAKYHMTFEPPNLIDELPKILAAGSMRKVLAPGGLLGLKVSKDADDQDAGVVVKAVFPGTPAAKAGFKAGDRLLTLDRRWTDSPTDCYAALSYVTPGMPIRAVVKRNGKEQELTVELRDGL
jgi:hypothetical protein